MDAALTLGVFMRDRRARFSLIRQIALLISAGIAPWAPSAVADDAQPQRKAAAVVDKRVSELIEQLGSTHYATRERAAAELSQLGLEAFDALHDAQQHQDIEVAERARYLINSMKVVWSRPTDSADVKRLLKDYSQQPLNDRRTRIGQLARLDGVEGLDALCRLVRFEMSTVLAKEAALSVMTRPQFAEPQHRAALRTAIADQIGPSHRDAALWIVQFEKTLEKPVDQADGWQQRIAAERKLLSEAGEKQTTSKIVRDLYRWQAELLQKLERNEDAIDAVRQMVALSDGSRQQLLEIIDWLMQRQAWTVVDEVVQKFPESFEKDPALLYRLAEAQVQRGDSEVGEKTAEQAFALAPMNSRQHLELAYQLQERGRFAWSEREYRGIVKSVEMISPDGIDVRSMLAEMLHDQQRDGEAAAVLSDLVLAMEADDDVKGKVESESLRRSPAEIISRLYFFAALDHLAHERIDQARTALEKGADANSEDADLLIAMYRLPKPTEDFKNKTKALIDTAATEYKEMVDQMQRIIDDSDNEQNTDNAKNLQAMYCNQYAWLVGNTEGDFAEAVKLSQRSLEVRPEAAGYMDTLAHAYYSNGDLENAVKWQAKAAKLEPHSGQITRALAKFEQALREKMK